MNTTTQSRIVKKRATDRAERLLQLGVPLVHAGDLAVLWGMTNENTLHTTIRRLVARGVLQPIYRGFYATRPLSTIDPVLVGARAFHCYNYLSTESVLAIEGVIAQQPNAYTYVGPATRSCTIGPHRFHMRQMAPQFLYNSAGVYEDAGGVRTASLARAVADMRYYVPHVHLDAVQQIDEHAVRELAQTVGFTTAHNDHA